MLPQTQADAHHRDLADYACLITYICLNEEFNCLRLELEKTYTNSGMDEPVFAAFRDALYTILVQEEASIPQVCTH
ncbi:MAG: hypothetical protein ACOY9Y_03735 [Bacillota bacterium]